MKRFVTLFIAALLFIIPFTLMSCESLDWDSVDRAAFARALDNLGQSVSDSIKANARMNRDRAKLLCPDFYWPDPDIYYY